MDSLVSEVKKTIKQKTKLCLICEEKEAKFCVKGIKKNCYCKDCALQQFGDLGLLEKL